MTTLAIDHGAGNIKIHGPQGGVMLPSTVSIAQGGRIRRVTGLTAPRRPTLVSFGGHRFYVGDHAHDWGRPIENLDDSRFITGSPETVALTYGVLYQEFVEHGRRTSADVIVGLPQSALTGDAATETARGLRSWLRTNHAWHVNDAPFAIEIDNVTLTSQAAGALFDYFLDDDGGFIPDRKPEFKHEIAVLSIGMNTLEMLVTERGTIKQRFSESETLGVRRLLELCDPERMYSRGELDAALRAGSLDYRDSLPVWAAEISGRLEQRWGRALRRFRRVIIVGGGALMLRHELVGRFNGRAWVPDDPIMSVARGLYKIAAMKATK